MPPRRCCCTGCLIAEDEFNRDGSDLGLHWTHAPGDWVTVASGPWVNGYAESQLDNAIAIHNTPHSVPDESMHVYMDIINEVNNSGDKYRVIVNAIDKDSYHFAEYIRNSTTTSVIRLGISSSGTDTILATKTISSITDPIGEPRRFYCSIADNEFCASVSHGIHTLVWVEESVIPLGYKAGIGADLNCQISYWYFGQHAQTLNICPHCLCNCETEYLPPVLHATLTGTGRMSGLSCTIKLEWVEIDGNWQGSATCCNQFWDLTFDCPQSGATPPFDVNTAQINVVTGCINSDTTNTGIYYIAPGRRYANETSTCTPISFVFGIFNVTASDFACGCPTLGPAATAGTYTITVTL